MIPLARGWFSCGPGDFVMTMRVESSQAGQGRVGWLLLFAAYRFANHHVLSSADRSLGPSFIGRSDHLGIHLQ